MRETKISEYIKDRTNYITNSDPDGIYTYVLINHFFKGNLVGFTNSKDCVYLLQGMEHNVSSVTYIDMFVTNPKVYSIDQHIISRTPEETEALVRLKTKLNPNLLFSKDLTDYRHKFPLSTFLFVLYLLNEEYDISIDWHRKITSELEVGHFLLDIDGVLTNLRDYNLNVKEWFDRLMDECPNNKMMKETYEYINSIPTLELKTISDKVRGYLSDNFETETKDGGFVTINEDNIHNVEKLIDFAHDILFGSVECKCVVNIENMDTWCGERKFCNATVFNPMETFSYAVVCVNNNNVSYTTSLKKKINAVH